jgi:hypothetical protein
MAKSEGGRPTDRSQPIPGVILPDAIYRADEAKGRAGWRDAAFRAACRDGLRVFRRGKRAYVAGADLVAFITKGGAN